MKLVIAGQEITISVKGEYSNRANKSDTQYFLNTLATMVGEAALYYKLLGLNAIENEARTIRTDIHDALDAQGFYS